MIAVIACCKPAGEIRSGLGGEGLKQQEFRTAVGFQLCRDVIWLNRHFPVAVGLNGQLPHVVTAVEHPRIDHVVSLKLLDLHLEQGFRYTQVPAKALRHGAEGFEQIREQG